MATIEAGRNHANTPQMRLVMALPLVFRSAIPTEGGTLPGIAG